VVNLPLLGGGGGVASWLLLVCLLLLFVLCILAESLFCSMSREKEKVEGRTHPAQLIFFDIFVDQLCIFVIVIAFPM